MIIKDFFVRCNVSCSIDDDLRLFSASQRKGFFCFLFYNSDKRKIRKIKLQKRRSDLFDKNKMPVGGFGISSSLVTIFLSYVVFRIICGIICQFDDKNTIFLS